MSNNFAQNSSVGRNGIGSGLGTGTQKGGGFLPKKLVTEIDKKS